MKKREEEKHKERKERTEIKERKEEQKKTRLRGKQTLENKVFFCYFLWVFW